MGRKPSRFYWDTLYYVKRDVINQTLVSELLKEFINLFQLNQLSSFISA